MPRGDVEVFPQGDGWGVQIEGESGQHGSYQTKDAAIDAARAEANEREVELIIRNQDGTIAARDTEGHDPRDVKG